MSKNDELNRGTDEHIEISISGTPEDEWNGLGSVTFWWVLTDEAGGGTVALQKTDTDAAVTIEQTGGGSDDAVVLVELTGTETEGLTEDKYYQEIVVENNEGRLTSARCDPYVLKPQDSLAGEVTS